MRPTDSKMESWDLKSRRWAWSWDSAGELEGLPGGSALSPALNSPWVRQASLIEAPQVFVGCPPVHLVHLIPLAPVLTWADSDVRLWKGLCPEQGRQGGRGPQPPPPHPAPRESHLAAWVEERGAWREPGSRRLSLAQRGLLGLKPMASLLLLSLPASFHSAPRETAARDSVNAAPGHLLQTAKGKQTQSHLRPCACAHAFPSPRLSLRLREMG